MSDSATEDLFNRARDCDIEAVAGTKMFRAGQRLRGECPICGASKGKKNGGAFSIDPKDRLFYCFGCLAGGDIIQLERLLRGGTSRQAAERLVDSAPAGSGVARPVTPRPEAPSGPSSSDKVALELWRDARVGLVGSVAEIYLRARGLNDEIIAQLDKRLRFHPTAKYAWNPIRSSWETHPAIISRVSTPLGGTGGVHATYLARDGRGKARVDMPKRMWGKQSDAEGRPGGVWLTDPSGPGRLIVGEGIESTASAGQLLGGGFRMVATLSLGRLQGGWMTDRWGRIDLTMIDIDPEHPAFTWPEPKAAPWGEVLIAVDRDMKPVRVKIRKLGGGTAEHFLDAEERARICAGLAVQAWKAAGANRVRAIAPAAGRDFNTELQECVV